MGPDGGWVRTRGRRRAREQRRSKRWRLVVRVIDVDIGIDDVRRLLLVRASDDHEFLNRPGRPATRLHLRSVGRLRRRVGPLRPEELCPVLQTDCARPEVFYGCIGQEVLLDEATLTCALDALIARTPGSFDILLLSERISSCGLEGCTYDRWRVQILGEDAVVSQCLAEPMTDSPSTDILRALETPEFFAACKEERTTGARLDCLFEGLRPGTVLTCR